jgi:hypothetical protein
LKKNNNIEKELYSKIDEVFSFIVEYFLYVKNNLICEDIDYINYVSGQIDTYLMDLDYEKENITSNVNFYSREQELNEEVKRSILDDLSKIDSYILKDSKKMCSNFKRKASLNVQNFQKYKIMKTFPHHFNEC